MIRYKTSQSLAHRWLMKGLISLSLSLALGLSICSAQNLPALGDAASDVLSPSIERRIGELTIYELRRDPAYLDDLEIKSYFNGLVSRLSASAREVAGGVELDLPPIEAFVVRDGQINAFAMPGGFIGVNTGLVLASQSESELAGVLAHEMAHVSQRHVARGMQQQKQDNWLYGAAMLAAVLAASGSGGDAMQAALAFSQAARVAAQLRFSRDAEREADRVGLQLLSGAGFDSFGMIGFLNRLQQSSQFNQAPSSDYAGTHPVTAQRIADLQNRMREVRYRQHPDSLEYLMLRARLRVAQASDPQERREAASFFSQAAQTLQGRDQAVARYGLALAAIEAGQWAQAQAALVASTSLLGEHPWWWSARWRVLQGQGRYDAAAQFAKKGMQRFPGSQTLALAYVQSLQALNQHETALRQLDGALSRWPDNPEIPHLRAFSAGARGQLTEQRRAMAQYYGATGALPAAIEQLRLARQSSQNFYEQSEIDVQLAAWIARQREDQALLDRFK